MSRKFPFHAWTLSLLLGACGWLPAQALDRDPTILTPVSIRDNGSHHPYGQPTAVRRAHRITGTVRWIDQAVTVINPNDQPCDLVIEPGGHLEVTRSALRIFGHLYLKEGGRMDVKDSHVELLNDQFNRFQYWWEGGHLVTHRTLIGGRKLEDGSLQNAIFQLNRGLWVVYDTTVQFSAGILLGEGRTGFGAHSYLRGGTLVADGLYQGENPDALILSGMGDATLRNSTFNLNFHLYADGAAPASISLDLDTDKRVPLQVYGDPVVHDGTNRPAVDHPIPGSPFRLELQNTKVPFWWVSAFKVTHSGQPLVVTLRNTRGLLLNVHGENLSGRPVHVGPWNRYYTDPSDLPSHSAPGEHVIPEGCGLRIGNTTFQAPANGPALVKAWGLYLRGSATNFTVRGPMKLAEVFLGAGQLSVEGTDQYNGRVLANDIYLHETGHLRIRNAAVGGMGFEKYAQGRIVVYGVARCDMDTVLTRQLTLTTMPEWFQGRYHNVNQGVITVSNAIEIDPIRIHQTGQGQITVQRASPSQAFDLQNLDFESGVQASGVASYYQGSNLSGYASSVVRPGSPGTASFGYRSSRASGFLAKELALCPGTRLSVSGWLRPVSAIGGTFQVRVSGASASTTLVPSLTTGQWSYFMLPLHEVQPNDTVTRVAFEHSGASGTVDVLIDDLRIYPQTWWEWDNFGNMDFEEPMRRTVGELPELLSAPDFWDVYKCRAEIESSDLRPGTAGRRSVRVIPVGRHHQVQKTITWLPAGVSLRIQGWLKGIPGSGPFDAGIAVGDGSTWWLLDPSNNNRRVTVPGNNTWQPFTVTYVVPANPTYTRIALVGGRPGDAILFDDFEVSVQ